VTDLYLWDSQKNDPNSDDPATKFRLFSFLASVNEVLLVRRFEQVLRVSENTKGRLWSHLHASFHGSLKHISDGQCDQNPQTAVTVWSKVTFKLLDDCLCSLESQFHPCPTAAACFISWSHLMATTIFSQKPQGHWKAPASSPAGD
jgi:hypothetical protein